jgi:O-antigen/teichoic acid export membrane protein
VTSEAVYADALRLLIGRVSGVAGALALSQVLVGLSYVAAARSISPATLGLIATCLAMGTIASTVFDAGLNGLLVREVASGQLTVTDARSVVRTKRRLAGLLLIPTVAVCLLVAPSVVGGLLLGGVGLAMWEAQTANALLRAQERFSRAATGQLVGRATGLVVVSGLVFLGAPIIALPMGILVSFAAEALLDRIYLGPPGARARPQRDAVRLYREGIGYGLAALAASAQQIDTPLVTLGAGASSAGIYAAAGRLLGPLGFLASALGFVGAPWLARAKPEPVQLLKAEDRVLRVAGALCLAPLIAAAVGPFLIPVLLGGEYKDSGVVFFILALGSVLSTANQPLAIIVQNRGRQQVVALAIAVGLGIGLAATCFLAIVGGATLAAGGFVLSQIYIFGHLGLSVRRLRQRREKTA